MSLAKAMQHHFSRAWLNAEPLAGVLFSLNDYVQISDGPAAGQHGYTMSLMAVEPEVVYLVEVSGTGQDVQVQQCSLQRVT
jgi:hypothetical protein